MPRTKMDSKMRKIIFLFLLVTCLNPSWSLENNLTMAEVPIELSITSEDDSERELSSQLEEVDSRTGGWSPWSEWSPCSRSCDGGASHQMRTCKSGTCRGEHVHYKICNMQAVAVLLVAVAYTSASGIGLGGAIIAGPGGVIGAPGLGLGLAARGAVEGALGGQWIPDVPVAGHGIIAPGVIGGPLGLGLGLGGLGGLGLAAPGLVSKGALEGALGGQWIPDTHGK